MMSDVFVIGAGCSVPYGFPTGAMLMQNLKDFNYGDNNVESPSFRPPSYLFALIWGSGTKIGLFDCFWGHA